MGKAYLSAAKKPWHKQFKRAPKERRTSIDGVTHDSLSERRRWEELKILERAGKISALERQKSYPLVLENGRAVQTRTGRVAKYTADFVYQDSNGAHVIEDVKGFLGPVEQLRIAIFEAIYGVKVQVVEGRG